MPLLSAQAVLKAEAALIGGKPQLTKRYHTAPLKIAKAFGLNDASGPQLAVVQMDASPGMLNGDRYGFDWSIGEKTRLYVTNQAYTRVHPCPRSDARAEMRFRLARDAVLEWMPEPVMLFREARYASSTEIELEPGAVCIAADLICPGRAARGYFPGNSVVRSQNRAPRPRFYGGGHANVAAAARGTDGVGRGSRRPARCAAPSVAARLMARTNPPTLPEPRRGRR